MYLSKSAPHEAIQAAARERARFAAQRDVWQTAHACRGLGLDLGSARASASSGYSFGRVTHVVEVDVALDPAHLGLLGAMGKVFEADGITDLSQ